MADPTAGLFLQTPPTQKPHSLEVFVRERKPTELHFYCRGLSFADFANLYGRELRKMTVLVYQMPPSYLNPNYWEEHSKTGEEAVREKNEGTITRQDNGRTLLWRSDQVPKIRMFRDDLDVQAELLLGTTFRITGENFLKLGRAASGGPARPDDPVPSGRSGGEDAFEWIGFSELPEGDLAGQTLKTGRDDLTNLRPSQSEQKILYTSQDDRSTQVVFTERALLHRAVSALLRGFTHSLTGKSSGHMAERVLDQIIRVANGVGITALPDRDFVNKQRTCEITGRLGKTEWGVQLPPDEDPPGEDDQILLYYDRVSGIWAVST